MRVLSSGFALTALFFFGGELQGQEVSTYDLEGELRTMVAEPSAADRDREVVRDFMDRADVGEAVAGLGLDPERLEARVSTLDAGTLADLARQVREVEKEADLVGGNTIVISTTTVIIILLVLILVT
ncbi:MAG: PA2779 family protein [Gemmatimonadota bacterium]